MRYRAGLEMGPCFRELPARTQALGGTDRFILAGAAIFCCSPELAKI